MLCKLFLYVSKNKWEGVGPFSPMGRGGEGTQNPLFCNLDVTYEYFIYCLIYAMLSNYIPFP